MYDHLAGSGYSHYGVCYLCLTPNGVVQNPLDFHHFAASVSWVYCSSPLVLVFGNTNASRCCFHTLLLQTFRSGVCGAFFQKALAFEKKTAKECGILMPLTIAAVWTHLKIDLFSSCSLWIFKPKECPSLFFFTFFIAKKVTKNLVLSKAFSGH